MRPSEFLEEYYEKKRKEAQLPQQETITAVNFLLKYIEPSLTDEQKHFFSIVIQQSKEMEKQQIIKAFDEGQEYEYQYHINNAPKFDSETYYAETFVSKGSEYKYHEQRRGINVDSFDSVAPKEEKYIVKVTEVEVPKQEISDEEIEKAAWEYVYKHKINGHNIVHWINAIKWYREQLKSK